MALAIREQFPTPHAIATASATALAASRTKSRPSNAQLAELQLLASQSIGTKEVVRQRSLDSTPVLRKITVERCSHVMRNEIT